VLGNEDRGGEGCLQDSSLEEHSGNQEMTSNPCAASGSKQAGSSCCEHYLFHVLFDRTSTTA